MAWIYLAESEGFHSAYLHGYPQPLIVRQTHTARESFCRAWHAGRSQKPQFGTMLEPSRLPTWMERPLTLSAADSLARTLVLRELEQGWEAADRAYFSKSFGWLASFDLVSFSWRTSQQSLFGGSTEFLWSSLRWGSTVGGRLYQPAKWVPVICERDGGFVPTPTARDFKSPGVSRTRRTNIEERRGIPLSLWFKETFGTNLHPTFVEWMMGYPLKHTVLEPWVMRWFRTQRGKLSCV